MRELIVQIFSICFKINLIINSLKYENFNYKLKNIQNWHNFDALHDKNLRLSVKNFPKVNAIKTM